MHLAFRHFGILELGTREHASILRSVGLCTEREGACRQAPLLSFPRRLGTRKETGLVGAEAAKEFPNRKTRGCRPQDKAGRSRGSWAVSHRVCSRQHAVKCPGQSTGKPAGGGWRAGSLLQGLRDHSSVPHGWLLPCGCLLRGRGRKNIPLSPLLRVPWGQTILGGPRAARGLP